MPADITIIGTNQLVALSKACKATGNRGLNRELLRSIQRAGKPLKAAAQESVLDNLPRTGGANVAVAARTKVGLRTRTSGSTPGVRVLARSGSDIDAMNHGFLRHPTYGGDPWVTQPIASGWWEKRLELEAPQVRRQIIAGMNRVAAEVARHG